MWHIPDWLPAAMFAGFWITVGTCAVWDLLRDK